MVHRPSLRRLGILTALILTALLIAPVALAQAGGGSKTTDCLAEFSSAANKPTARPRKIVCDDQDPSCDDDPRPGHCMFTVQVCLNATDAELPACTHTDLEFYEVENFHPDTDPRHDFDFQTLEDSVGAFVLPVAANQSDECSGDVGIEVPMPVRIKGSGARYSKGKKTLRTTAYGPGSVRDEDTLRMQCRPGAGADPCANVTSTFMQIQEHILTPGCSRQTCHSAAQGTHNLSLVEGESHAALFGTAPANLAAASAGKLRVDPGNPDNSYLLDKLRGHLEETEGVRMPKDMPKLKRSQIRLIEAWIEAGAPATGYVAPLGCQAP